MRSSLAALLLVAAALPAAAAGGAHTVVVLVYDGFAPSLVDAFATPALDRMRREGTHTHTLLSAFPTNSLINGVSLSTGCWPERHGIVANRFLDPERGVYDHWSDADWLTGCEHLHQVAERQGLRAAALGWYGRFSGTRGALASVVPDEPAFEDFPDDAGRAEQVLELLALPVEERPRLLLAYFRGPDDAAHFQGMQADETRAAVEAADASLARILDAIDALPDRERVALFVGTDHGMLPVSHVVNVTRILRRHGIAARSISDGSTAFLYLDDPAEADAVVEKLSGYEEFEVWRKDRAPAWSHIGAGPRVGDVVLSAHPPYFTADVELWPTWLRWLGRVGPDVMWARFQLKATHGYRPDTPGVAGILYARGAGIARGRELPSARVIDLHPTVTALLGIAPGRPLDGRAEARLAP